MFTAPVLGTYLVTASVEGRGTGGGGRRRRRGYWLGVQGETSHPYKNLKIGTVSQPKDPVSMNMLLNTFSVSLSSLSTFSKDDLNPAPASVVSRCLA